MFDDPGDERTSSGGLNSPSIMTDPEIPPILKLPTEIRLKIYDLIIHSDIDCRIINDVLHTSDSNGTQATLIPNQHAVLKEYIPWLNLQLTCRDIEAEIKSFMGESSFLNRPQNRTYVLDFDVYSHAGRKAIRSATWRSLPCPPLQAQHIVMNIVSRTGPTPFTEGGAASLARALYQSLNHLMHNGPRFHTNSLLERHMRIEDLVINIDAGSHTATPASGCDANPPSNYSLFKGGWTQISRTGFLNDYVGKTILRSDHSGETEIPSEYQKVPAVPGYWRGYGFQWGIECAGYRSL